MVQHLYLSNNNVKRGFVLATDSPFEKSINNLQSLQASERGPISTWHTYSALVC